MKIFPYWMKPFSPTIIPTNNDVILDLRKEYSINEMDNILDAMCQMVWYDLQHFKNFVISGSNKDEFYLNINSIKCDLYCFSRMFKIIEENKDCLIFCKFDGEKTTYELNVTDELYAELSLIYLIERV